VLLKTKFARWKVHFLIRISKKTHVTFIKTDGVLLKVRNWKDGCCAWSLVATTSHVLILHLVLLQGMMIESPSLIVLDPCLTHLSSACISFMPNQVYSLARIYHRSISWWFHKCLPFCSIKCLCITDFEQVPYMVSIRFWVTSFWSCTWLQEPFCSSYLRKHHFCSLSLWLCSCLLLSYLVPKWHSWIVKIDPIPKIVLFISTPC
jgi:hypothetical protein